jgi:ATP-dependent RNA helicase DeaD
MTKDITFKDFKLSKDTFDSITKKGFEKPSEIQVEVIPQIFERKNDIVAIAQTGTGKTAAFGLPIIDMISENNKTPKVIILSPTRELALQITKELDSYSTNKRLNILTVYGGAPIAGQIKDLKRGVDIIVGTPGRVVDMINRKALNLKEVDYFILDEADEMLNMGFVDDLEFILSVTNDSKRVYLFSATMPKRIKDLSKKYMKDQITVEIEHDSKMHTELIDQVFYRVSSSQKTQALMKIVDFSDFFPELYFVK